MQVPAGYQVLWNTTAILGGGQDVVKDAVDHIIKHKADYQKVENATGVPWVLVGALHMREGNGDFRTHLHNGDPLTARTRHVPRGRPPVGQPPFDWWFSASDALTYEGFDKFKGQWSIPLMLYAAERYNGTGYLRHNENSPYVWAQTNHEERGKFTGDGHFDPSAWDHQPGVAAILYELKEQTHDRWLETVGGTIGGTVPLPQVVIDHETKKARRIQNVATSATVAGSVAKGSTSATVVNHAVDWAVIGVVAAVALYGAYLLQKQVKLLKQKWGL